jgi:hypothetical protein
MNGAVSLTGIITKIRAHDAVIQPEIEQLKARIFGHNPPQWTVILHRREIVRKEKPYFDCLRDPKANNDWENSLLALIENLPYIATTVTIDKQEHAHKYLVWQFNPYHYCMRALIERYVLWLNRNGLTGDVVAEPRFKKQDKKLKRSFNYIYDHGTEHIPAATIQKCLTSREIKFETKAANVAGLQNDWAPKPPVNVRRNCWSIDDRAFWRQNRERASKASVRRSQSKD